MSKAERIVQGPLQYRQTGADARLKALLKEKVNILLVFLRTPGRVPVGRLLGRSGQAASRGVQRERARSKSALLRSSMNTLAGSAGWPLRQVTTTLASTCFFCRTSTAQRP